MNDLDDFDKSSSSSSDIWSDSSATASMSISDCEGENKYAEYRAG